MHLEGLDELDNKILDAIKDNVRLSYSEIGEKVNVSSVCVKNRMTALEQKGIIKEYRTMVVPSFLRTTNPSMFCLKNGCYT